MRIRTYILSFVFLLFSAFAVYAYVDISSNFDTSLVQGIEYSYSEPRKILFVQVEGRYDQLALNTEDFLDTVYYYSITKLKLGHMPFHYAVDESGNVYKTSNYDLTLITDEPYLVVAYLSNNGQLGDKPGRSVLEVTEELSYTYGITGYEVKSFSLSEAEDSFSEIVIGEPSELFKNSIDVALEGWQGYEREHRNYTAEIVDVQYPESVEVGKDLEVTLTVKNVSDFIWTSDKYPIYVSTANSEESIFAVNEVWDSFSKATRVSSDEILLPEQEVELKFSLDPKVLPGEHSESFVLLKFEGEAFEGSEFTVDFVVVKGDQELVRIDSPEAGYVNIRNCRRFSCEQIDVVNDGEVYPVVEYHESCWYKIQYAEGKEGWFYCPYAEEVE